jgi:hypothetical protein
MLLLNVVKLEFRLSSKIRVGKVKYDGDESFDELRRRLRGTHVTRRRGNDVEIVALTPDADPPGEVTTLEAGSAIKLVSSLLFEWLIVHFSGTGRPLYRHRRELILVSTQQDDDLLARAVPKGTRLPQGVSLRAAYRFEPRVIYPSGKPEVVLVIDSIARVEIDVPVDALLATDVPVQGFYVCRRADGDDSRLGGSRPLVGRVAGMADGRLILADHDEGWPTIPICDARLEPRLEVLEHVVRHLGGGLLALVPNFREQLRAAAGFVALGENRLRRIRNMASYLRKQEVALAPGLDAQFGDIISTGRGFPPQETISKPSLIFDPGGRKTERWNQGGLDRYGPYDQYQFNPKSLNIAVICQAALQGRVDSFVAQLLGGVPNVNGGAVGFLRRFALEKPYIRVFTTRDITPTAYRQAAVEAIDHITDQGKTWNLAIVQTNEAMEILEGDANPYLVSKAFFLSHGIAVQHVHLETIEQPAQQRVWSLNNVGLACYAKLGGVPWLLPTDQKVAHELVIGLGSYHERSSRFGGSDRYVGITTVFSGDGRYLLESRTRAVPFGEYAGAMLEAVRRAIGRVRGDFAWGADDPVRLVFHAFKPVKDVEADAVRALMGELMLPHAEYAFVHVADSHPFLVFNENEAGAKGGRGTLKGKCAPPRGLFIRLSDREVLLCLKGARELKQATDGHPEPLMLHLHRESSFQDLTYLARQAFAFSCHSWRSFLPSPIPITILYSELVARNLKLLSGISGWTDDAIVGRIGRTRWFL